MAMTYGDGDLMTITAPTGGITNNTLVIQNRLAGVALNTVAAGVETAVALTGVFEIPAVATGAKTMGNRVFYRTTGGVKKAVFASGAATGAKYTIGNVWETATAASTTCKVRLIGAPIMVI